MNHQQNVNSESASAFVLSAFGDEIDDDREVQLRILQDLEIGHLELRKAWGTGVLKLNNSQLAKVKNACNRYSSQVSCIGSPIGKSLIQDPLDRVLKDLERAFEAAEIVGTNKVRIFSFYPPKNDNSREHEHHIEEVVDRLSHLAILAEKRSMLLLMENEGGLVGDTPESCQSILAGVASPNLRFVWDTGNFPHSGIANATELGWPLLKPHVAHVQIKDALLADQTITVAGQGDGQVQELLKRLRNTGYRGFLALEPHLKQAWSKGGYSGPDGMKAATAALRELMARENCPEVSVLRP